MESLHGRVSWPRRCRSWKAPLLGLLWGALATPPVAMAVGDVDGDGVRDDRDRDLDGDGVPNYADDDSDGSGDALRGPVPRLPPGFFGIVAEETGSLGDAGRAATLGAIAATGARTFRKVFHWNEIEARRGSYDFGRYDALVADSSRAGLTLLPVLFSPPVFYSAAPPGTASGSWTHPPADYQALALFASALVLRYGPAGSFWRERQDVPARPIRRWQIWNEPNLRAYWPSGPSPREYVRMAGWAAAAIRHHDPAAHVVSAGLAASRNGVPPARFLRGMYRHGARKVFDSVAVHAYAPSPDGVTDIVAGVRRTLKSVGDGSKPIRITETGAASDGPHGSRLRLGERPQAVLIRMSLRRIARLRRRLGIRGVVLYSWRDMPPYAGQRRFWGHHTGLLDAAGRPKLALTAWTETVTAITGR